MCCACDVTTLHNSLILCSVSLERAGDGLVAAQHMLQMGNNDACPSRAGFALDMTDLFRMCVSAHSRSHSNIYMLQVGSTVHSCGQGLARTFLRPPEDTAMASWGVL